ncbi:hypothetical protein K2X85_08465 [bacterium]|nr:hypothetical protein [bacterium]
MVPERLLEFLGSLLNFRIRLSVGDIQGILETGEHRPKNTLAKIFEETQHDPGTPASSDDSIVPENPAADSRGSCDSGSARATDVCLEWWKNK